MLGLPEDYVLLPKKEIVSRIKNIKAKYRDELVILGHHYEHDTIVELSDLKGDSFALAKMASEQEKARHIVFCGVYFMAEAACVLAKDYQTVYIPNEEACCPLADFAQIHDVERAWQEMGEYVDTNKIVPACYMNSSAAIKAFCGKHGGIVCTSSNAADIFKWALDKGEKLFFMPDEQLGKNTASKLGINKSITWDPNIRFGGNTGQNIKDSKIILWKGYCHVHAFKFTVEDIKMVREKYPEVKVVVHPECTPDVVQASDESGSTAFIIKYAENAPKGSVIAVGTELNLVNRLYKKYKDEKLVIPLKRSVCPNMMKISPGHLLYCLENLGDEQFVVNVDKEVITNSKKALERMLEIGK